MKKILALFLSVLLLVSGTACGEKPPAGSTSPEPPGIQTPVQKPENPAPEQPQDPAPQKPQEPSPEKPQEPLPPPPAEPKPVPLTGDSYWVAYESTGDLRGYVPEAEKLLIDLTLWADGTARIREIEDGICLISGTDEQNMTWTYENDGTLSLYSANSGDTPYCAGKRTADGIELNRFGGVCRFREESMPEGGNLYSPAELYGVWLQIGSEVEGYIDASLPHNFNSLIFRTDGEGAGKCLLASAEAVNYGSFDPNRSYTDRGLTVLDQPIYEGCGNDEWSVRIGEESPRNQHGYPSGIDTYVTLLDQNTLLRQQYYSFDNGSIPGVSYQTYKRFLPESSDGVDETDLADGNFNLVRYIDADGISHTEFSRCPAYTDFRLRLNESGSYAFTFLNPNGDEFIGGGNDWVLGDGGTILLRNNHVDEDCYSGTVAEHDDVTEIFLWDNVGGIMVLERGEDGEWSGYVDTMTDIEGIAFSAPANTLCVLYNQNFTDFSLFPSIPAYEISDSPDAQYVLVASVEDGSYFWLEEDGYCREDFGTVDAGDSFLIRLEIPEKNGFNLQVKTTLGEYFFELKESTLAFVDSAWNYVVT